MMRNVYIVISQGNVYRDLVRLGMLRHLLETAPDLRVVLLTQAYAVPEVRAEVAHERLVLARHDLHTPGPWPARLIYHRRRQRTRWAIDLLTRLESWAAPPPVGLKALFAAYPPSLVVSTHPQVDWEWDVISFARKRGVPSAGIVKSWDNVLQRPRTRVDHLAVWNRANHREALEIERYRENEVEIVGAAAFDQYFKPDVIRPRDEFWRSQGLDPARPVILFGSAGSFTPDWDETFMLDLLLRLTGESKDLRDAQIVCRLHPITHLEWFWPYRAHPRVTLSFGSYVKTLGWCMTRDEVDEMANLLCHSDVVITPASTLSIEAPIFDTPTIATLFSEVRPQQHEKAINWWLANHFKPIVENDWLPLARSAAQLGEMLRRALADRSWYREGRRALVEEYVTHTDGRSYQRVAAFLDGLSGGIAPVARAVPSRATFERAVA